MKKLIPLFVFIVCVAAAIWIVLSDSTNNHLFQKADAFIEKGFTTINSPESTQQKRGSHPQRKNDSQNEKTSIAREQEATLLAQHIERDFRYLRKNNFLGFKNDELGEVQVLVDPQIKNQKEFQKVADLIYSQFPKSKDGKKKLEITIISGNDSNATKTEKASQKNLLVLQFSLTDRASQNKTWEMGRTYSY